MKKPTIVFCLCLSLFVLFFSTSCITSYIIGNEVEKKEKEENAAVFDYMKSVEIINRGGISSWEVRYYVDEFGSPTSSPYVTNKEYFKGTFSNTATNGSTMYARFLINKYYADIELFEYDSKYPVTGSGSDKAKVKIQVEDGTVYDLGSYGFVYNGKRILIDNHSNRNLETLYKAFVENTTVKFRIEIKASYSSFSDVYNFTVDTRGFEEMYSNAFIPEAEN